jgi:hypothetical protein
VAHDGLVNRLAAQQQQGGVAVGLDLQRFALAVQQRHLRFAHHLLAVDLHRAVQHHQRRRAAFGNGQHHRLALAQPHVPDVDRREGVRRPLVALIVARDHAHAARAVRQVHLRDVLVQDALVARRRHLVPGRQVDPQLHHFKRPARARELARVEFLMQDARGRRHPLHVARADHAAVAGRVAVLHLALVDDGHGLKPAVRVLAHAARRPGRLELRRAGIVQQQKGADMRAQRVIGEQRAHGKAVTDPVAVRVAVNAQNFFHRVFLLFPV